MAASLSLAIWAALGVIGAVVISIIQLLLLLLAAKQSSMTITLTKGWLLVGPAALSEHLFIIFSL